jgi:hypothetical protein
MPCGVQFLCTYVWFDITFAKAIEKTSPKEKTLKWHIATNGMLNF